MEAADYKKLRIDVMSMRTKKVWLFLALVGLLFSGCYRYDDCDLWGEIANIKKEIAQTKADISTLQKVVKAQQEKKTIDEINEIDGGYEIKFNDGTKVTIKNGLDAPELGIQEEEGIYYWTLGGKDQWLKDKKGNKIPVAGKDGKDGVDGQDGHSPVIGVDKDGYWTLDGERIKNDQGKEVQAVGKDGDSFFQSVRNESNAVVFVLANGEEITIPKTGFEIFAFEKPEGEYHYHVFKFNEARNIKLTAEDIATIEEIKVPEGWSLQVNAQKKMVRIKAPKQTPGQSYNGGIITLMGLGRNGATYLASIEVIASIDYTDPAGTFVVCEGNMTTVNGTIVYYDKNNNEYLNIFENANNHLEIGNVVQDMYMANGKIYLITQNGDRMNGAGRFVVCDARTMKMEYADSFVFKSPKGEGTWPQHIVICNDSLGYVQWSDSNMEQTSGIIKIIYKNRKLKIDKTVEGTFGKFTTEGAIKTRLVFSRGKVYAACGHGMVIIDPKTNSISKRLEYKGRQAKGIVKGANGHIFVPFAGEFKGNQQWNTEFTSDPIIVEMDHEGTVIQEHKMPNTVVFPVATWSPAIGICASFTEPHLYFVDVADFNASTASRYNYETKKLELHYVPAFKEGYSFYNIYGIMGVHPTTGHLWVGRTAAYVDSDIFEYDVTVDPIKQLNKYHYPTQRGASTAGIDFAYRFSDEFINK